MQIHIIALVTLYLFIYFLCLLDGPDDEDEVTSLEESVEGEMKVFGIKLVHFTFRLKTLL